MRPRRLTFDLPACWSSCPCPCTSRGGERISKLPGSVDSLGRCIPAASSALEVPRMLRWVDRTRPSVLWTPRLRCCPRSCRWTRSTGRFLFSQLWKRDLVRPRLTRPEVSRRQVLKRGLNERLSTWIFQHSDGGFEEYEKLNRSSIQSKLTYYLVQVSVSWSIFFTPKASN